MGQKKRPRYVQRPSGIAARGYACVALERPTDPVNVGHTLRAAMCFGARMVIIAGAPAGLHVNRLQTDPQRAWRHIPTLQVDDVFDAFPYNCVPVGIEMTEGAVDLVRFTHPERACYIFGPENNSLSADTLARCEHIVKIPTALSLNLAATVNVVLYDRLAKSPRRAPWAGVGGEDIPAP